MVKKAGECTRYWYKEEFLKTIAMIFLPRRIEEAMKILRRALNKKAVVTLSGKDSIVSLHIAITSQLEPDVIINTYVGQRELPSNVVEELYEIAKQMARRIIVTSLKWNVHSTLFNEIAKHYDYEAVITGLRQQENELLVRVRSAEIVSPIWRWRTSDVWAYAFTFDLSIPSLYCRAETPFASLQRLAFSA